jgi:hypothetical protein
MVMDGLEVLSFRHVGQNTRISIKLHGDIPHHVLYELKFIVRALRDVFFIGALEPPVALAQACASTNSVNSSIGAQS